MKRMRYLYVVALGVLCLSACTQNLETNQTFQDQVTRVDRIDQDLQANARQVAALDADVQMIGQSLADLTRKTAGQSPDAMQAVEQRLVHLETTLNQTAEAVAALTKRLDAAESQAKRVSVKAAPAAETKPAASAPSKTSAASKPAEKKAVGAYHQIQKGDTLDSIAKKYKVSVASIRQANHLPADTTLIPGQRIYVPAP